MKKSGKKSKKARSRTAAKSGESLETVFYEIKDLLARHAPPFKLQDAGVSNKFSAQLVVPKAVSVPGAYGGKPVDLQMAAVILQKGYVGFYLMCVYLDGKAKAALSPALRKLLRGKTCFHVKALDDGQGIF